MACFHPIPAFRTRFGQISLHKEVRDSLPLRLPCGTCNGCRASQASAWALRCHLELQDHDRAAHTTLTFDNEHCPPTLARRDLQLYLKRARKALGPKRPIRYFASGEYGEHNKRPHYHLLLFGADQRDSDLLQRTWGAGYAKTKEITPATIAYVAGYTAKKISDRMATAHDRIDYTTGEIYRWQPPFIQMSRRPGIGGSARQYVNSWRLYAVHDGQRMPVPRFLHQAWKDQATPRQLEDLLYEKSQLALNRDSSEQRLEAAEQIAMAKQHLQGEKRHL